MGILGVLRVIEYRQFEDGLQRRFHLGAAQVGVDRVHKGQQAAQRMLRTGRGRHQVLDRGAKAADAQLIVLAQASQYTVQCDPG